MERVPFGMRLPLFRVAAFVALVTALVTASGISTPRSGAASRDRDRVVRVTRGGPQRLDATDGTPHSHEESDAVITPATDLLEVAVVSGTDAVPGSEISAIAASAPFQPDPGAHALVLIASQPPPPARCLFTLHAPGRAPPAA